MARFAVAVSLILLLASFALAQSDPQALAYAAQSMAALTGGNPITDVTLSGTVTRTPDSDVHSGPVTLYGKGLYESRIDMNLDNGNRSDIRNSSTSYQGEWIDSDGNSHPFASFNCMTDPVWFFPALSSLAAANDPNQVLTYAGQETLNGAAVQHLVSVWSGQTGTTMNFYLDAGTFLPVQISITTHPDTDPTAVVARQVSFMSYQSANGIQVPTHTQLLVNGNVFLDIVVSNSAFNTGLPDSLFVIQ
jgi:hypothetical protein